MDDIPPQSHNSSFEGRICIIIGFIYALLVLFSHFILGSRELNIFNLINLIFFIPLWFYGTIYALLINLFCQFILVKLNREKTFNYIIISAGICLFFSIIFYYTKGLFHSSVMMKILVNIIFGIVNGYLYASVRLKTINSELQRKKTDRTEFRDAADNGPHIMALTALLKAVPLNAVIITIACSIGAYHTNAIKNNYVFQYLTSESVIHDQLDQIMENDDFVENTDLEKWTASLPLFSEKMDAQKKQIIWFFIGIAFLMTLILALIFNVFILAIGYMISYFFHDDLEEKTDFLLLFSSFLLCFLSAIIAVISIQKWQYIVYQIDFLPLMGLLLISCLLCSWRFADRLAAIYEEVRHSRY